MLSGHVHVLLDLCSALDSDFEVNREVPSYFFMFSITKHPIFLKNALFAFLSVLQTVFSLENCSKPEETKKKRPENVNFR